MNKFFCAKPKLFMNSSLHLQPRKHGHGYGYDMVTQAISEKL